MRLLVNTRVILVKGFLLLVIGLLSLALLASEQPTLKETALIALAIWSFCRFYYFAFYIIEHYVDSDYRFTGLLSFAGYIIRKEIRRS
jgi:hypothetical protein